MKEIPLKFNYCISTVKYIFVLLNLDKRIDGKLASLCDKYNERDPPRPVQERKKKKDIIERVRK